MKNISSIMHKDVETITKESSIMDAAKKMKDKDIGFLVVTCNDNKVEGVLTDRDIVIRAVTQGECTKVENCMTNQVFSIDSKASLQEVSKLMGQKKVRRIVVTDDGKLAGVVSIGDLFKESLSDEAAREDFTKILEAYNTNDLFQIFDNSNYMDSVKVDDYKL